MIPNTVHNIAIVNSTVNVDKIGDGIGRGGVESCVGAEGDGCTETIILSGAEGGAATGDSSGEQGDGDVVGADYGAGI